MASEVRAVIQKCGSSCTIYLRKGLFEDSLFPFEPGEELRAKIDGQRVVIEKPTKREGARK